MNLYILPIIMSADKEKKTTFLLTQENKKYVTPIVKIEYPEFFHKEALQHIVHFFTDGQIKINAECKYNYLTIQDELSIKYVHKNFDFVKKEDLIITYGGILLQYECNQGYQWTPMINSTQHQGFSPDMNFNFLLNTVIQKSMI